MIYLSNSRHFQECQIFYFCVQVSVSFSAYNHIVAIELLRYLTNDGWRNSDDGQELALRRVIS